MCQKRKKKTRISRLSRDAGSEPGLALAQRPTVSMRTLSVFNFERVIETSVETRTIESSNARARRHAAALFRNTLHRDQIGDCGNETNTRVSNTTREYNYHRALAAARRPRRESGRPSDPRGTCVFFFFTEDPSERTQGSRASGRDVLKYGVSPTLSLSHAAVATGKSLHKKLLRIRPPLATSDVPRPDGATNQSFGSPLAFVAISGPRFGSDRWCVCGKREGRRRLCVGKHNTCPFPKSCVQRFPHSARVDSERVRVYRQQVRSRPRSARHVPLVLPHGYKNHFRPHAQHLPMRSARALEAITRANGCLVGERFVAKGKSCKVNPCREMQIQDAGSLDTRISAITLETQFSSPGLKTAR